MAPTVVFVEQADGKPKRASLECLGAAQSLGEPIVAVVTGPGAETAAATLGKYGAKKVVCAVGGAPFSADATAKDVAAIAREQNAKVFLAAATSTGKDVAPRVAAHLDAMLFSDCVALSSQGGSIKA